MVNKRKAFVETRKIQDRDNAVYTKPGRWTKNEALHDE